MNQIVQKLSDSIAKNQTDVKALVDENAQLRRDNALLTQGNANMAAQIANAPQESDLSSLAATVDQTNQVAEEALTAPPVS